MYSGQCKVQLRSIPGLEFSFAPLTPGLVFLSNFRGIAGMIRDARRSDSDFDIVLSTAASRAVQAQYDSRLWREE